MPKIARLSVLITELSVLLRAQTELPPLHIRTKGEFIEGWNFARLKGASPLERKIRRHGWHFIRIAHKTWRSGVGESSQQAISSALQLAVRSTGENFNALEVRDIHLTRYPWFVLAKVGVFPYKIQQSLFQFVPDDALLLPTSNPEEQSPANASRLSPQPGREMPTAKEMLTQSRSKYERVK
jgi:hypothetical protein